MKSVTKVGRQQQTRVYRAIHKTDNSLARERARAHMCSAPPMYQVSFLFLRMILCTIIGRRAVRSTNTLTQTHRRMHIHIAQTSSAPCANVSTTQTGSLSAKLSRCECYIAASCTARSVSTDWLNASGLHSSVEAKMNNFVSTIA